MLSALCSVLIGSVLSTSIQVDGEGYLRFAHDKEVVYAKRAELSWRGGVIVNAEGDSVWPKITIEKEPNSLEVDLRGHIKAIYSDQVIEAGRLVLAIFPDDVRPVESGKYLKLFGDADLTEPGEGLAGVIRPWSGTAVSAPAASEPEKSFVRVHSPDDVPEQPLSQKEESVTLVKRTQKTNYTADSGWVKNGGIEVAFPDVSEVTGPSMRLGDVADIFADAETKAKLAEIDLGTSPVFGVPRQLDRNWILGKLKAAGFPIAKIRVVGPVRIQVKRVGQTITQAMFEATAVAGIKDQYPDFEAESTKPTPDLDAPEGLLDLRVDRVDKSGSRLSVTVVAYVDGKRINSRTLTYLNKGMPINLNVGDDVTVVVQSGGVKIETTGKVKKVDRVSGEVLVQLSTGKQMTGRVGKSGKIEVSL
ncbi:MAG: hypothetical protein ACKVQS_02070 [Fimbriimonadaceae bacterium]